MAVLNIPEWAGQKSQVYIWDLHLPGRVIRRWNGKWNLEWNSWRVNEQGNWKSYACSW